MPKAAGIARSPIPRCVELMMLMLAAPGTELSNTKMVIIMKRNVLVHGTHMLEITASDTNFKHWNVTAKIAMKFNKKLKGLMEFLVCLMGVGVLTSMSRS
eukprot:1877502-Rhodomonas_salina.1